MAWFSDEGGGHLFVSDSPDAARESLVSDILAGDVDIANLFYSVLPAIGLGQSVYL
jgi:hypothetical protein